MKPHRFAIARYLPLEARLAAVAARYEHRPELAPRTAGGPGEEFCPLGIAIHTLDPHTWVPSAPTAEDVAGYLVVRHRGAFEETRRAAQSFMHAWDAGCITDLAMALGVPSQSVEDS